MNSDDSLTIMTAISDMRAEVLKDLGEVKATVSGADNKLTARMEAIQNTFGTFREELLGNGGRITNIEEEQKLQDRRQWWHSALILPLVTVLHSIANYLGIRI